jgi:hypothetical protein
MLAAGAQDAFGLLELSKVNQSGREHEQGLDMSGIEGTLAIMADPARHASSAVGPTLITG